MANGLTLYGAPGFGSVAVEATMKLLGVPYEAVDIAADTHEVETTVAGYCLQRIGDGGSVVGH